MDQGLEKLSSGHRNSMWEALCIKEYGIEIMLSYHSGSQQETVLYLNRLIQEK